MFLPDQPAVVITRRDTRIISRVTAAPCEPGLVPYAEARFRPRPFGFPTKKAAPRTAVPCGAGHAHARKVQSRTRPQRLR
jgi:hypothetical protein